MSAAKTLLIVYHSFTGGTQQMAEAARAGAAAEDGVVVRLLHAAQATPTDVLAADGYVFATPENLAAMSGQGAVAKITARPVGLGDELDSCRTQTPLPHYQLEAIQRRAQGTGVTDRVV
jgi:hypothetical protein